jgi:hypothetical protein
MPPIGPIAAWAARKGVDIPPFVIARAIARRGIPGAFILRDTIKVLPKFIDTEVRREVRRVLTNLPGGTP